MDELTGHIFEVFFQEGKILLGDLPLLSRLLSFYLTVPPPDLRLEGTRENPCSELLH